MFTALHGLARRATLHIIVASEGEQLRVTVQPKPNGSDAPIPPALSLLASPEEFDRDFTATVAQYQAPATSLLEQGKAAAQAVEQSTSKAKTQAAAKAPAKKAAAKPAAKKAAPTQPAAKPAAKTPEKKDAPAKPEPTKDSSASPADREALIELATEYLATLPASDKPTRAGFIKRHKAGRRYERMFGSIEELFAAAKPAAVDASPAATGGTVEASTPAPAGAGANETILSPEQVQAYMDSPDNADEKTREAMVNEPTEAGELLSTLHTTSPSKPAETLDGSGLPPAAQEATRHTAADILADTPALSLI